jgi:hypothetical protein
MSFEPKSATSCDTEAASIRRAVAGKRTRITPGFLTLATKASQPKSLSSATGFAFGPGHLHQFPVDRALLKFTDCQYIVPARAQCSQDRKIAIFVREKPHPPCLVGTEAMHFFVRYCIGGVRQASANILFDQPWVAVEKILDGRAFRQLAQEQFHRNAGVPDDRLSLQD